MNYFPVKLATLFYGFFMSKRCFTDLWKFFARKNSIV